MDSSYLISISHFEAPGGRFRVLRLSFVPAEGYVIRILGNPGFVALSETTGDLEVAERRLQELVTCLNGAGFKEVGK